ncbi:hypothetical protein P3T76_008663 [Phytophthora citrophthora]|uniref:Retrotransposon gag domain-containing protein n=1 Tax=Phytophthora citrophthora TaxID=4793 RepID=A0AAD9LL31_9STRA|nr:hypothetical protein P3T76_008663 [Phytophthora citrophthora]
MTMTTATTKAKRATKTKRPKAKPSDARERKNEDNETSDETYESEMERSTPEASHMVLRSQATGPITKPRRDAADEGYKALNETLALVGRTIAHIQVREAERQAPRDEDEASSVRELGDGRDDQPDQQARIDSEGPSLEAVAALLRGLETHVAELKTGRANPPQRERDERESVLQPRRDGEDTGPVDVVLGRRAESEEVPRRVVINDEDRRAGQKRQDGDDRRRHRPRHRDGRHSAGRERRRRNEDAQHERRLSRERHERRGERRQIRAGGDPPDDDGSSGGSDDDGRQRGPARRDDGDEDNSGSDGSSSDSSSEDSDSDASREARRRRDHRRREPRRDRHERRERRDRRGQRERDERDERRRRTGRRNIRDLELPTFTPSARVSVTTWIDRVDLALQGARESGRGEWSDRALYFILGNKLLENAARWWVNADRRLTREQRTWTNLKRSLLRRYAPPQDLAEAEWRVNSRAMMAGETYADFAAGLRDAADRNAVEERVFLAQFYRNLDRTTRQLVKQPPAPQTLEEAVDKATELSDPMDNVARGMRAIGQPFPPAPGAQLMQVNGPNGATVLIPGVGGIAIPEGAAVGTTEDAHEGQRLQTEEEQLALFTNPQGVYNRLTGVNQPIPGREWTGRQWEPKTTSKRRARNLPPKEQKRPPKRQKVNKLETTNTATATRSSATTPTAQILQAAAGERRVEVQTAAKTQATADSALNTGC